MIELAAVEETADCYKKNCMHSSVPSSSKQQISAAVATSKYSAIVAKVALEVAATYIQKSAPAAAVANNQ